MTDIAALEREVAEARRAVRHTVDMTRNSDELSRNPDALIVAVAALTDARWVGLLTASINKSVAEEDAHA